MKILAIDVGYHNIGVCFADCSSSVVKVEMIKKVSLEDFKFSTDSNELVDLVPAFCEAHEILFETADVVLVERQPPQGLKAIEALIHYMYKPKVVLVSPNSLHAHFGIAHLNYDERKVRVEKIASHYIKHLECPWERKHDIADAVCMVVYYHFRNSVHIFDRFRFLPAHLRHPTKGRL